MSKDTPKTTPELKKKWTTPKLEDVSISTSTLGKPSLFPGEGPSYAPS